MTFDVQQTFEVFALTFSVETVRYLIAVGIVLAFIPFILRRGKQRDLHSKPPEPGQIRREFFYSLLTGVVFAANGLYVHFGMEGGWAHVYEETALDDLPYMALTLIGMLVAHDAWFYWTHRALHHRMVFNWAHNTHHKSRQPTAWAAYAFAPPEAFINGCFVPIWVTFVPTNGWVIFLFLAHMILKNVAGHSGIELYPTRLPGNRFFGFITNVFHHDLHHRDISRGNYGLYFTWWDRWMGTEHKDYAELVATQRAAKTETAAAAE